jgi:hypothetical protein
MSTAKFNQWLNSDGTENYKCRAWVNFNGTGTVAIRASGNVTSITDNGTGDYTVNFTTALTDANYAVTGTAGVGATTSFNSVIVGTGSANMATGSCRISTKNISGASANDVDQIQVAIFR